MVYACVGPEKAREFLPQVWKEIVPERFEDYRKETLQKVVCEQL
jgi:hypothetical protein